MRVLGIDPGTRHLGWGILERVGARVVHRAHGVIDTDPGAPLERRLVQIDDALIEVLAAHTPEQAAVESIFFAKDAQAASKLGHARGVVLLRLARAGIASFEYAPTRVKRAVVGAGQASKEQVQRVMTTLLGLSEAPRLDASDALANAFAHLAVARFQAAVGASGATAPAAASPAAKLLAATLAARRVRRR